MLYYCEINIICIVILLLVLSQLRKKSKDLSTDQRIFKMLILMTALFCVSDMVAGICRGKQFEYARVIIEISNLIYYVSLVIISFLWYMYVEVRLTKNYRKNGTLTLIKAIPVVVFTVIACTNPFTNFLFTINQNNLYQRGNGVYLHWVIVWLYFLIPTVRTLRKYLKEKQSLKRQELAPMLLFAIAPLIASIIQMLFYGVTSTQVGITIALVQICLSLQNSQILTDALTGVNNRRSFDNYLAEIMQRGGDITYTLLMIDVDEFKSINDKHGHMMGDYVLQNVAVSLKNACKVMPYRLFLCRFGGDEFVIFGAKTDDTNIETLKASIECELYNDADCANLPEKISLSVGVAEGKCSTEKEFNQLLVNADKAMYDEKNLKRINKR